MAIVKHICIYKHIVEQLMGCIVCYILHNLMTLRHDKGYFPSSDDKPCEISSDIVKHSMSGKKSHFSCRYFLNFSCKT